MIFRFLAILLLFLFFQKGESFEQTKCVQLPPPFFYCENLYFFFQGKFVAIHPEYFLQISGPRGYQFHKIEKITEKIHRYEKKAESSQLLGSSIILMEYPLNYFTHFFHLLEHLVGVWAFYGCDKASEVKHIILAGNGSKRNCSWEGPNRINYHVLKALFPHAEVYTWDAFLKRQQGKLTYIEKAIISDRGLTLSYQACAKINKFLGAALPYIDPKKMESFASQVQSYAQTVKEDHEGKLHVTYVQRPLPRCLTKKVEEKLIRDIEALPNVILKVVDFAKMSFKEQINLIGNTDVLIGVHGNGLSHTLFLPSNACLIEIFPPDNHHLDFRVFAESRGIDYYGVLYKEHRFLDRSAAFEIGSYGTPNESIDQLDTELIISAILEHFNKVKF